jgi:drug/metabolite transporter (DMT)-like permease
LVLAVVLLNAAGNLLMAWGMKHIPDISWSPVSYLRAIFNPFVAAGTALLILWLLTRMALLSWADLSFVLPLTGLGYILNAALGRLFLNESITAAHWLGTLFVFAGTAMVGSTQQQTRLRSEART